MLNELILIIDNCKPKIEITFELQKERNSNSVGPFIRNKFDAFNLQYHLLEEHVPLACLLKAYSPFLSFPIVIKNETLSDYYIKIAQNHNIKCYSKSHKNGSIKLLPPQKTIPPVEIITRAPLVSFTFYIKLNGDSVLINPFFSLEDGPELLPITNSSSLKHTLKNPAKYKRLIEFIDLFGEQICWETDFSLFLYFQSELFNLEKEEKISCNFLIEKNQEKKNKKNNHHKPSNIDWLDSSNQNIILNMEDEIISFYLRNRKYSELNFLVQKEGLPHSVLEIDESSANKQIKLENYNFKPSFNEINMDTLPSYLNKRGFTGELKEHQKEGVLWILRRYINNTTGALLSDEMGLGKTIQALSFLAIIKSLSFKSLIICPASLKHNWTNEIGKFYPSFSKDVTNFRPDGPLSIINIASYEQARADDNALCNEHYDLLIIDESQRIKNKNTLTWNVLNKINSSFRIIMTGTPIENSENDLLSAMCFIMHDNLPHEWIRIEKNSAYSKLESEQKVKVITSFFKEFILSRKKIDHITLPQCIKKFDVLDMEPRLKSAYSDIKNIYLTILSNNKGAYNFTKLDAMLRLRQLCSYPRSLKYVFPKHALDFECNKFTSTKSRLTSNIENGIDTILFTTFLDVIDAFEEFLISNGITYSKIDGRVTGKSRELAIYNFTHNSECRVLLSTLHVGGVGLNLTNAREIILYNSWWNPAVEEQAIARVHRIGLKHDINVYIPIYKSSIEEKILELLDRKRVLAQTMDSQLLTDDDFIFLLS
ncbi:DEAD/DEAH box helicase [Aeromonas jandaei]|uniref:DEAD/DEAH box helicase n=1 Tax=Aeromonas jandaei TaxID=650 RepID=UPI0009E08D2F|nr:DEAD/DEAH box helicase [Aeromonas jandaei]